MVIRKVFITGVVILIGLYSVHAGLYTYLYFACIGNDGKVTKPFMLPQKDPLTYYERLVYSYNVPDFINKPVQLDHATLRDKIVCPDRVKLGIEE